MPSHPRRSGRRRPVLERTRMRRLTAGISIVLSTLLFGCPDSGRGVTAVPPRTVDEALTRVNAHTPTGDTALYCTGLVSIRFRDANRTMRQFFAQPMTLIFRPERCLYFNIKSSLAGSLARVGSNDDRYWLCVDDSDFRKMWWGEWAAEITDEAGDLPVPPNDLFDALLLRPLTQTVDHSAPPYLRIEGRDHRLIYVRLDDDLNTAGYREIVLDAAPPYLPREITDRSTNGDVLMHARLENWRRVGDSQVITARHYVVEWPQRDAELRIDIDSAKFRPEQPPFCEFPRDWKGPQEQISTTATESTTQTESGNP